MKRKHVLPLCLGVLFASAAARSQENSAITLEELVRASLERNREVLALRQRVAQTQGLRKQAGVRPALEIQAEGGSGKPLGSAGEQEFAASAKQVIETFGKRADRMRVAEFSVALAEAEIDARSTQVSYDVETAYL
ncbi:MAG: outer membrane protein heavy metal efflux system, partial [Hyphomicrobiales bacterium]|nr:outer membrane protein heavy metal efflux system [Hyphomicrobiales bacterium]